MMVNVDIELLVVADCPHKDAATQLIQDALSDLGISQATVRTTVVHSREEAQRRGFTGSPTFRLDDRDLLLAPGREPALACRMYMTKDGLRGVPEASALRRALKEAADPLATPKCGCCGRSGRRMAELGTTPGTFICWTCALWAIRRAARMPAARSA